MGPKAKLALLLLQHQGSLTDDLARYSSEDCSAMLFLLTRYGYLTERSGAWAEISITPRRHGEATGYVITERGQTLLNTLVES